MEISDLEVRKAIASGAHSFDSVKRTTKAGMGLCQGRICEQLVESLITEVTGFPLNKLTPMSVRPPIRPVKLEALAEIENDWL
jgi:bacterioferritin-associated ferredoxin